MSCASGRSPATHTPPGARAQESQPARASLAGPPRGTRAAEVSAAPPGRRHRRRPCLCAPCDPGPRSSRPMRGPRNHEVTRCTSSSCTRRRGSRGSAMTAPHRRHGGTVECARTARAGAGGGGTVWPRRGSGRSPSSRAGRERWVRSVSRQSRARPQRRGPRPPARAFARVPEISLARARRSPSSHGPRSSPRAPCRPASCETVSATQLRPHARRHARPTSANRFGSPGTTSRTPPRTARGRPTHRPAGAGSPPAAPARRRRARTRTLTWLTCPAPH